MQQLSNIYCSIYPISIAVFIKYFCNIYQISFLSHDFLFLEREGGERSLEGPTTPFSRETNNNAFSSQYFPIFNKNLKCFPIIYLHFFSVHHDILQCCIYCHIPSLIQLSKFTILPLFHTISE